MVCYCATIMIMYTIKQKVLVVICLLRDWGTRFLQNFSGTTVLTSV